MNINSTYVLAMMLLLVSTAHSQSLTWETLNTATTKTINDIHFLNADTGYLVGNDYLFKKTVDGGDTWQDLTAPTIGEAEGGNGDIIAVNRQIGGLFGGLGTGIVLVWKKPLFTVITSDDGETYAENFGTGTTICDAKGLNITPLLDGNGYVQLSFFGERCVGGSEMNYVYDGPFTVAQIDTSYNGNGGGYTSMDVNPNTSSIILGHDDGNILRHSNIFSITDTTFLDTTGVGAVAYAGNDVWYAATSHLYNPMYKSMDDGLTFEVDASWFPTFFYPRFRDMEFLENGLGLAGAESNVNSGAIAVQNGSEWNIYFAEEAINTVTILENATAFAAGENGLLMRSSQPITVGVREIDLNNLIDIYPNPANTIVHIANKENSAIKEISILDNSGRILRSYPPASTALNLSAFPPSLYFVKITTSRANLVKRIVIIR